MKHQKDKQPLYIVMADYGGAWAWHSEYDDGIGKHYVGGNIASDDWWGGEEKIPDELIKEFCAWQAQFERSDFWSAEPVSAATFPWGEFNQQGLALCCKLKAALGDSVRVCYEKTHEEAEFSNTPDKDADIRQEVMSNGSVMTWPLLK